MTASAIHPDLDYHALSPLHRRALEFMDEASRYNAARYPVYEGLGFGEMEIARRLGITWKALDTLRRELQGALVKALAADGYSDSEVARYLGIKPVEVTQHTHEPTCHRGMSGEWEARCQCDEIRRRRGEHQADDGYEEWTHRGEAW
jgi:hypothetical protein